jgi:CBS domain-containing protein
MKAADVMTHPVVTIESDASVTTAVNLMLQNRISGVPVVDRAGKLVGIVTEGDFLRRTETGTEQRRPRWLEFLLGPGRGAGDYVKSHARRVAEVMTAEVLSVGLDTPLDEIVRLMERRHVKRVPVVENGKIVGIVSRANLLRVLAGVVREVAPASADDAALREAILAELRSQSWAPLAGLDVTVRNGVVGLWGTILDERERDALRVAAENVPGVKSVEDHLCWIEPVSGSVIDVPPAEREQARAP